MKNKLNILIIGRTEILYQSMLDFLDYGHKITGIITGNAAPEYKKNEHDFQLFAKEQDIPFLCINSFKSTEAVEFIEKHSYSSDIGISMNFPTLVPKRIIDVFPLGILNAHGGDLPRYRGNACQAWAILNNEEKIGLCIHKMVPELDAGDIISRDYMTISINTKIGDVFKWFEHRIPDLFLDAMTELKRNSDYVLETQSIEPANSLRCFPRNSEDGKIDWAQPAEDIIRLINASSEPYSGAYCFYENKKVIIWEAKLNKDYPPYLGVPGQVTHIDKKNKTLDIITGNGIITLTRVEIENDAYSIFDKIKSVRERLK